MALTNGMIEDIGGRFSLDHTCPAWPIVDGRTPVTPESINRYSFSEKRICIHPYFQRVETASKNAFSVSGFPVDTRGWRWRLGQVVTVKGDRPRNLSPVTAPLLRIFRYLRRPHSLPFPSSPLLVSEPWAVIPERERPSDGGC
ncbi:hypothetical protein DPEC_G00138520 [Dallia pectoralis]|uniref:Uncharacterized protein n=1 Tax=Dallia pectoralis TaxID=75939 RepID=A0ACC2GLM4_DALPE|nr:hypothetical protein DPEC_G00138520 [Dallia pectoralis]